MYHFNNLFLLSLDSNIKNRDISSIIGKTIFLVLVLGDFISYMISSVTDLPSIPFGVFAYSLVFISLITFGILKVNKINAPLGFWLVLVSFLVFFLSAIIRIIFDSKVQFKDIYLVFLYLIFFSAGIFIGRALLKYRFNKIFYASLIMMVITLISLADFNNFNFLLLTEEDANYLRLAEWFVICALGSLAYIKNPKISVFVFVISLISLFIINSRFALAGFFIAGSFIIFYRFKAGGFLILSGFIMIFILSLVHIFNIDFELFKDNRVIRLILTPDVDTSLLSRREINLYGWKAIKENWFIGDFRGQVSYGGYGNYIHNILSYWRQYGLITFLCFFVLFSLIWSKVIKWFFNQQLMNSAYLFGSAYLIYVSLGIFLAKSFLYTEIFMVFGLIISLDLEKRNNYKI